MNYSYNLSIDDLVEELKKMDVFNITIINTPDYLTDYFIVGSVDNIVTLKAIVDKFRNFRIHGQIESGWIIIDFIDYWCHLFLPNIREHYNIERLWSLKVAMKGNKDEKS